MLLLHIISALTTLTTCVLAWIRPSKRMQTSLNILTILSLGSGLIVSLDQLFTRATCIKLGIYLVIIGSTKLMLRTKLAKANSVSSS